MLQRLHEQRQAVTAYSAETDIPTITAYQWALIENILRILQPFEEITKQASSDKEIISFVIPAVATLKSYLSKRQKDEGVQTMKQALKDALENRFLNDNKINIQKEKNFCIATAVDPRFKSFFFNDVNKVKRWIIMEMDDSEDDMGTEADEHDSKKKLMMEKNISAEIHEDIWNCFSEFVNKSNEDEDNITIAEGNVNVKREELENFLSIPLIKRSENPIEWWKHHINEFPRMKPLILKYLSAPPSSVNSERLFSAAKRIYTDNRNRLAPNNAEKLLFIMQNMKYNKFPFHE